MENLGLLVDTTKCTGCRGCQVACKQWNQLPAEPTTFKGTYQNHPDLTANNFTILTYHEYEEDGQLKWYFTKRQCMHCLDPACMKVCPQKAISQTATGAVVRDMAKCVGCQYCTYACPFHVPKYNASIDKVTKCSLCVNRVAEGLEPACVKACVTGALQFGKRDELLALAKQRVDSLLSLYPRANIYGETEAGGTNILYVLTDFPGKYGLPEDPKVSPVTIAWNDYIKPYGPWLIALTAAGSILSFFTTRLLGAGKAAHEEEKFHG
ncbi:MAG: 4Fe-4S dicluster domain-containing protein [Bacillota bacterium]|nr:4Fe-4S dicluster domain-containing protein [Bacillota bacterium]